MIRLEWEETDGVCRGTLSKSLLELSTGSLQSLVSSSKSLVVEEMEAALASAAIIVMVGDILFAVIGCSRRSDILTMESLSWGGADTGQ